MRLWVKAVPRHVRFHDLRHTTATLLLKKKVPLATVQKLMRHSSPTITARIYGHLDVEDLREGVDSLSLSPSGATAERPEQPWCAGGADVPANDDGEKDETPRSTEDQGVSVGRPDWFRTNDLFRVKEALYR